jgi:enoyl-CoA hydratase/carnithine racemase
MRLGKGFAELTKAKVTCPKVLREGVLCGKRYASGDALQAGLIDQECSLHDLADCAEALATAGLPTNLHAQFFNPTSFRQMKQELYADAYRTLTMAKMESLPSSRL